MSKATKSGAFKNIPEEWVSPVYDNVEDMIESLRSPKEDIFAEEGKMVKGKKNYLLKRSDKLDEGKVVRKQRRRLKERAVYGVTQSDFWSFGPSTGLQTLVNVFRGLPETVGTKKLADLVVELNDVLNYDGDDYYYDAKKEAEYARTQNERKIALYEEIKTQWGSLYVEALKANPNPNTNVSDFVFEYATLETLKPRDTTKWVEWRGIFSDPTATKLVKLKTELTDTEYSKVVKKHELQRTKFGFSDLDVTFAPFAFAHWKFVNALVYLASNESYVLNDAEQYLEYAKGLLAASAPQGIILTAEQEHLADKAVKELPVYIPGMWD